MSQLRQFLLHRCCMAVIALQRLVMATGVDTALLVRGILVGDLVSQSLV